ncbi:MAG: ABC transporter ATP-binding protein/permease, partial [Phycisphaerae bacterium]|nr:ABC transporter ATP-binding protein/permease [Phycisphaerae bacterium]
PDLARRFNADATTVLGVPITIPAWLIDLLPDGRFGGVVLIVAVIALLTVLGAAFNFLHQYLSLTVATHTAAHARERVFRTAMFMPLIKVTQRGASEFVARILQDSVAVQRGLIALMSKAVAQSTQAVVLFLVAVFTGRSLTIAALVILPLLAIVIRKIGKRIRRAHRGALERQEDLLRVATESVQGLRAVKANTREAATIRSFAAINRDVVREELRARIARAASSPFMETIAVFAVGALVILAARAIIGGTLTIERFVIALGALAIAGSKLKVLAGLVNEMQAASAPARRLMEIMDEASEETGAPRPPLARHATSIRFEDVGLTYPGATEPALSAVTLAIGHGERIAIVGPNGCGKTTLLSLLPRLLVPDTGRILIDDVDIATISLASLRGQIGVVTQETFLFRGTIAENIGFGVESATDEQIRAAARRAHADEFVRAIPGGYDATIAERGASLSGGQRQRLAIARAILREPAILILDEATSQIDAESETHIAAAIAEFGSGRTVLVIAHRLATVLDADRIVVMDRGRIVDEGTHDALLGRCPLYGRLSQNQLIAAG